MIEAGDQLLPIEVKATASPRLADCAHLRSFRAEYGSSIDWLTPDVLAAPWWRVL